LGARSFASVEVNGYEIEPGADLTEVIGYD
jgi:hypothetical protein